MMITDAEAIEKVRNSIAWDRCIGVTVETDRADDPRTILSGATAYGRRKVVGQRIVIELKLDEAA
jgi:hypothetical protein